MLRIREKQLQIHNRKCSCLKNYKYIRYIRSIIHIKYINSFFFCYTNLHRAWRSGTIIIELYHIKVYYIFFFFRWFWFCGGEYLPRKLFIVDSLTVKAFPFSSFSAMRRFNSSSPGMQTTAIRLKSLKPFILRLWAEAYAFVYKNIDTGWCWLVVVALIGWLACCCCWLVVGWLNSCCLYCCLGCVVRWLVVGTFSRVGWESKPELRNTLMICRPLFFRWGTAALHRPHPPRRAYKLTHTWDDCRDCLFCILRQQTPPGSRRNYFETTVDSNL